MTEFISQYWLDITTCILGLLYIWYEYRVSIWVWVIGIVMPMMDIVLYWQHGLYGDSALAAYYLLAAVYGLCMWLYSRNKGDAESEPIKVCNMPRKAYLPVAFFFACAWIVTYYVLVNFTASTVPVLDGFTNAMSFVGLWALSRKYVQQWLFWIAVDVVCCYLYIVKGIPFHAGLYGLYVILAIAGYIKWKQLSKEV